LRVTLRKGIAFGPGKADLLEGIRSTGSIAAAGRLMKMSYTRAWGLVSEMNEEFSEPLVASVKGGSERGGATLTRFGEEVVARFRRMERASSRAVAGDVAALRKKLR